MGLLNFVNVSENSIQLLDFKVTSFKASGKRLYDDKPMKIELTVSNGKEEYKIISERDDLGTYRDDNVSSLATKIKVGSIVDVVLGELGLAINTNPKVKKYYSNDAHILPDRTQVWKKKEE